jgi:hypothetical protein
MGYAQISHWISIRREKRSIQGDYP